MCLYSLFLSSGLFRLMHGSFGYFIKKKKKKKKKKKNCRCRERAHVAHTKSQVPIVDGIDMFVAQQSTIPNKARVGEGPYKTDR
jgi:hypothetical protein